MEFWRRVVRFSLRFKRVIIALAIIFLGYGIYSLTKAKYDVFPDFAPPQVTIHAEAPGLSPEQVEVLVTRPVESAVNGVQGIESMRSSSIQGFSAITITFKTAERIYTWPGRWWPNSWLPLPRNCPRESECRK